MRPFPATAALAASCAMLVSLPSALVSGFVVPPTTVSRGLFSASASRPPVVATEGVAANAAVGRRSHMLMRCDEGLGRNWRWYWRA